MVDAIAPLEGSESCNLCEVVVLHLNFAYALLLRSNSRGYSDLWFVLSDGHARSGHASLCLNQLSQLPSRLCVDFSTSLATRVDRAWAAHSAEQASGPDDVLLHAPSSPNPHLPEPSLARLLQLEDKDESDAAAEDLRARLLSTLHFGSQSLSLSQAAPSVIVASSSDSFASPSALDLLLVRWLWLFALASLDCQVRSWFVGDVRARIRLATMLVGCPKFYDPTCESYLRKNK